LIEFELALLTCKHACGGMISPRENRGKYRSRSGKRLRKTYLLVDNSEVFEKKAGKKKV